MSDPQPAMHERRSSLVSVTAALVLVLLGLPGLYVGGYFAVGIDHADISLVSGEQLWLLALL
jgi:hypothetical protein